MGMSTHIEGIRDLDGKFAQMLAIKKACDLAKTSYPAEVQEYFEAEMDEPEYASEEECRRQMAEVGIDCAVREAEDARGHEESWIIDLTQLPEGVKEIRVTNSW